MTRTNAGDFLDKTIDAMGKALYRNLMGGRMRGRCPVILIKQQNGGAKTGMFEEVRRGLESCGIPERMRGAIVRYIFEGSIPGGFLKAIITNDLKNAVGRADDENLAILNRYIVFFYNHAPAGCWGGPEQFENWVKRFNKKEEEKS